MRSVFRFHAMLVSPSHSTSARMARRFASMMSPSHLLLVRIEFQRSIPSSLPMICGAAKLAAMPLS